MKCYKCKSSNVTKHNKIIICHTCGAEELKDNSITMEQFLDISKLQITIKE